MIFRILNSSELPLQDSPVQLFVRMTQKILSMIGPWQKPVAGVFGIRSMSPILVCPVLSSSSASFPNFHLDSDDDSPFEKPPPPTKPPSKTAGKANPVSRLANTARPVVKSSVHTSAKRPTAAQRPPLRTKAAQVVSHTDFGLGETNIVDEF